MSLNEYKLLKLNTEQISVLYGAMLFALAVIVSSISDSKSFTSYIPAIIGAPISAFGIIAILIPSKQKLFMHLNVLLGLFVFLGGLSVVVSLMNGVFLSTNFWADFSRLFMVVSAAMYLTICIKSFIFIRKKRV